MSRRSIGSFAYRRWALMLYWVTMFVATHWPEIDRYGPRWRFPYFDQVVHAGLYAGWAAMWWWLLSAGGRTVRPKTVNWLGLGGLAYAVFDEATQAIVERDPALVDVAADLIGIVCAITVLQFWQRKRLDRSRL